MARLCDTLVALINVPLSWTKTLPGCDPLQLTCRLEERGPFENVRYIKTPYPSAPELGFVHIGTRLRQGSGVGTGRERGYRHAPPEGDAHLIALVGRQTRHACLASRGH